MDLEKDAKFFSSLSETFRAHEKYSGILQTDVYAIEMFFSVQLGLGKQKRRQSSAI